MARPVAPSRRNGAPVPGSNGAVERRAPRTVVELRGFPHPNDQPPLYMRTCPSCGFFEVSDDPALLWLYRQCPSCDGA